MTDAPSDWLIVFTLEGQHLALDLARVERIVPAAEIAPLPDSPAGVRGVINVQGKIVPVFDLRVRFGLPPRELRLSDHFVVAHTTLRTVALIVDTAAGVVRRDPQNVTPVSDIMPGLRSIEGVMKIDGDMVLIHDLEAFLTAEARAALEMAMAG